MKRVLYSLLGTIIIFAIVAIIWLAIILTPEKYGFIAIGVITVVLVFGAVYHEMGKNDNNEK